MIKKVILYFFIGVVGILVITNPTLTAFKEFFPSTKEYTRAVHTLNSKNKVIFARKQNYFVFSVYTASWHILYDYDRKYIGIFGNFIDISEGQ